jgi:hypothetical protein
MYDFQRESISALIVIEQEEVISDIVLMDKGVILVPIQSQTYLLRIQTDLSLTVGPFIAYSKFY